MNKEFNNKEMIYTGITYNNNTYKQALLNVKSALISAEQDYFATLTSTLSYSPN